MTAWMGYLIYGLGAAVIVFVLFSAFRQEGKKSSEDPSFKESEENIPEVPLDRNFQEEPINDKKESDLDSEKESFSSLLTLTLAAPRGRSFSGEHLKESFERSGLAFGKYDIFHWIDESGHTCFSVASAVSPGTFDPNHWRDWSSPGLNFFLDLNLAQDPKLEFKKMLACVYELAHDLQGDILDEHRARLTQSSVSGYLAKIKGFESAKQRGIF